MHCFLTSETQRLFLNSNFTEKIYKLKQLLDKTKIEEGKLYF